MQKTKTTTTRETVKISLTGEDIINLLMETGNIGRNTIVDVVSMYAEHYDLTIDMLDEDHKNDTIVVSYHTEEAIYE